MKETKINERDKRNKREKMKEKPEHPPIEKRKRKTVNMMKEK